MPLFDNFLMTVYPDIYGISDHDLMFEIQAHSEIEGEADVDDDASNEFVKSRVCIVILIEATYFYYIVIWISCMGPSINDITHLGEGFRHL